MKDDLEIYIQPPATGDQIRRLDPFRPFSLLAQRFGTDLSRICEAAYLDQIPVVSIYDHAGTSIALSVADNEPYPDVRPFFLESPKVELPPGHGLHSFDEIGILGRDIPALRQILEDKGWLNNETMDIEVDLQNHPHTAPELLIAIRAWKELFGPAKEGEKVKSHSQVMKWLEDHYPGKETGRRNERIASIVTPGHRKNGGVLKTEDI